jgi:hypothetical protein
VTARPAGIDSAVMNDRDEATKFLFDVTGPRQVSCHVLILALTADQTAIERVDKHRTGFYISELRLDAGSECFGVLRQIERRGNEIERRVIDALVPDEGFLARRQSFPPFQDDVNNGRLLYAAATVFLANRNKKRDVHCPE